MALSIALRNGFFLVFLLSLLPHTSAARTRQPRETQNPEVDSGGEQCDHYADTNSSIHSIDTNTDNCQKCFALFTWKNNSSGIKLLNKGCWQPIVGCSRSHCEPEFANEKEDDPVYKVSKGVYFCCCLGNMCNREIVFRKERVSKATGEGVESTTPPPQILQDKNDLVKTIAFAFFLPTVVVTLVLIFGFFIWRRLRHSSYTDHQRLPTMEPGYISPSSETSVSLDRVQRIEVRAHGRYGYVWKAQHPTGFVAVKVFPPQDQRSWVTEKEIYNLPQMQHDNILRFMGTDVRGEGMNSEMWLVTVFHEHGSLYDYLKMHVLTWSQMCTLAESMARGLAFLHEEIPATSTQAAKPAVAHRDFKSKNVLLKDDLTACISDFGLALKFEPGRGPGETHGLVGTRRYMAPEVLEGAICFNRDSFLRIDMYACGLVLWELLTRCNAAEGPLGEYQLPFESPQEVGPHPTLEAMQEYVVTRKMRPPIHEHWKRHMGMSSLVATIEECWDQDAEARLSAGCVQERIATLTRTLNSTGSAGGGPPVPPPFPTSIPPPPIGGQSPPHCGDSVISFSSSSDIPPKDLSSC